MKQYTKATMLLIPMNQEDVLTASGAPVDPNGAIETPVRPINKGVFNQ